jgi:hypothetical protein
MVSALAGRCAASANAPDISLNGNGLSNKGELSTRTAFPIMPAADTAHEARHDLLGLVPQSCRSWRAALARYANAERHDRPGSPGIG